MLAIVGGFNPFDLKIVNLEHFPNFRGKNVDSHFCWNPT